MNLRTSVNPGGFQPAHTATTFVFQVEAPVSATPQRSARRRPRKPSKIAPTKRGQGKGPRCIDPSPEIEPLLSVPGSTKRHHRHNGRSTAPNSKPPPPKPPASELLRRAKQAVDVDTDWLGRRPFIMDVILNAKSPVLGYSEDVLLEALEKSQTVVPRHNYVFTDRNSVDQYWTEHAALWRGIAVEPAHYPSSNRYPISAERSTATSVTDGRDSDGQQGLDDCLADQDFWPTDCVVAEGS